ncbi:MAG TPA: hypothetical protein VFP10_07400 [Candidatus Eisenbacteria bacterium]|nr:hypothetical protein [Candidatus Eisenbacteria bacterium]
MPKIPFDALPDSSRLWIFPSDRRLLPDEQDALVRSVEAGLAAWSAHGSPVTWGVRVEQGQCLMIGVDETRTALTGCSIDSAIARIRELETRFATSLLDNGRIFLREGDEIRGLSRPEFKKRVGEGTVTAETLVFDNTIVTVGAFRRGAWEIPFHRSWHREAFPIQS